MEYLPHYLSSHLGVLQIPQPDETFSRASNQQGMPSQVYRQAAPSNCGSGPKACAHCGTTRTPQWREGPEGPKTLCNACGVKRVRQMRTSSEGLKKKASRSPAVPLQEAAENPVTADYSGPREPREQLQRRPSRKMSRTKPLEEELHVEWPVEEDEPSCHSSQVTGSDETGGHNSDSAEEVAWIPERHARPCHLPPSPMAEAVGPECAAAVNLLSMSVGHNAMKAAAPALQRARTQEASGEQPQINAASYAQMANSALKWSSHMPCHAKAQDLIQDAVDMLPADKQAQILAVKAELDVASREAAAADAAVAAVAKILAMKQAAAIKARASAAKTAKRVHTFMQTLDSEYGWSQQSIKRQRSLQ